MGHGFRPTAGGGLRWEAEPAPHVGRVDLDLLVRPFATGWNRALGRVEKVPLETISLVCPPPVVISVAIRDPSLRVRSFRFAEAEEPAVGPSPNGPRPARIAKLSGSTRISPPADVIKLEDRLRFLLQPSLEAMLAQRSLEFPLAPFPYQMEGIAFLFARHAAILADEMGLGKTMQAITAIRLLLRCGEIRSVLLVCPKPLVSNWRREFDQWAPEIPLAVIEGDQGKRRWQWRLSGVPVKIANYELLLRDRDLLEGTEAGGHPRLLFDLAVLDEAQRIKNRRSATSRIAQSIGRRRNWALTGTPVENSAEDLVGIFEFLLPGYLSPQMKPGRMGRSVGDYVLRRTKDQVLSEMPPKLFRDAELRLSPQQQESYRMAEDEGVLRLGRLGEGISIQHVFELILRLKQICNFDPATLSSSKLERLEADLEEVAASGRKALVFSQWVGTLKRLARHLKRFGPLEFHGKVPGKRRQAVIERFRRSPDCHVMLISYAAGGVGLNLQFANYVFLFDRWWNPAVEDQAINRAHRIGVDGSVTVTRFLMLDTIEERIQRVLEEKRELFETIFSGTRQGRKLGLTQGEIFALFDLKGPAGPIRYAA